MDDEVEAAQLLDDPRDEHPHGLRVGDVAVAPACREDAEPVSLEPRGHGPADAAGAAGDERGRRVAHAGNDKLTRA